MTAPGIDVHAIKPGLMGPYGRIGKFVHNILDFRDREGSRFFVVMVVGIFQIDRRRGYGRTGIKRVVFFSAPPDLPGSVMVHL